MFRLPAVNRYRLANAPLVQALAQVRFPLQARLGTLEGVAAIQDRISDDFPYLEQQQVQSIEFAFGPEGPKAQVAGAGSTFTFTSEDGHAVVLAPDSATLTVGASYRGVEDFSGRFEQMVSALLTATRLPRFDRLGVRYLNLAQLPPGDAAAWTTWFRPEVLGWAGGREVLDEDVQIASAITQINFTSPAKGPLADLPAEAQAFIRHGLAPAGSAVPGIPPVQVEQDSFIIDVDCFVVAPHSTDVAAMTSEFRVLHDQIDRFFYWTLAPVGATYFGREEQA